MKPNPRDARLEHFALELIDEGHLLPAKGPILVGLSGGPDSVALLHFLAGRSAKTGRPPGVIAAHVNHGLREKESDADAVFARNLAADWGLPYLEETLTPRPASEEAARLARYAAFHRLALDAGADRVATAHTADDQAETVLLRLVRGAGLRGLAGMPSHGRVQGVRVVRPLLHVTREQVLQYLRRHALTFRVDSSNEDRRLARNFIRMEILPRIVAQLNPAAREAILRGASAIREAERYMAEEARGRLPEVLRSDGEGKISLDAVRMLDYPKPLGSYLFRYAVLELSGSARDLAASHINALLSLAKTPSSRSVDLPGGIRARRERGRVVLEHRIPETTRSKVPSKT